MPAFCPVDNVDEAGRTAEGKADNDIVLPGAADVVVELVVAEADDAVVELAELEVDVELEVVAAAKVSLEIQKPGLEILPILLAAVSLVAMKRKTLCFVIASSEEGNSHVQGKVPA